MKSGASILISPNKLWEPKIRTTPAWKKPVVEYPEDAVIKTVIHEIPASSLPPPEKKPPKEKKKKRKMNVLVTREEFNYRAWTEEENQLVIKMYTEGASLQDITEAVHHSEGATWMKITKLKKQGLITTERKKSLWTPEMDETLLRMRAEGVPFSQIAKVVGKSTSGAYSRYHKLTTNDEEEDEYEEEEG